MDGIDTLEEYRESRQALTRQKEEITAKLEADDHPSSAITEQDKLRMVQNIRDVVRILQSEDADMVTKANAIRRICEKITFDKAEDQLRFYFIM